MKKKVYTIVIVLIISIVFGSCNINAASEDENIEATVNIDSENNVIFSIQTVGIKSFEGILDYDDETLEFIEVESQNGWDARIDLNTIVASTNNDDINNKKEIAKIKFRIKNDEDIISTSISMYDIKIVKSNYTVDEHKDVFSEIEINNNSDSQDEFEVTETFSEYAESADYSMIEYGADAEDSSSEEYNNNDKDYDGNLADYEGNGNYSDVEIDEENTEDDNGNKVGVEGEQHVYSVDSDEVSDNDEEIDDNSEKNKDIEEQKDNLANGKIPQTGIGSIILGSIIIIILIFMAIFFYKKIKKVNKD